MQETPFTEPLTKLFSFIGESWSLQRNAWNAWNVYLIYKARFLPLGPADLIISCSPGELQDKVIVAQRAFDLGMPYPFYDQPPFEKPEANPYAAPEITPRNPWEGLDTSPMAYHAASREYPLARLSVPQAVLQQILQLPGGYDIKHLAIEDGALCVYCLTPETANLSPKDVVGQPAMRADYQLEDRNGYSWRRLESVHVDIVRSSTPKEQT